MYFPFLICEVICDQEVIDVADRQNMHSCSVAVRALLKIEQEADKYRQEPKTNSLSGKVLVFSISHNSGDARLYGHYATLRGEEWTYYHYLVQKFDLTQYKSLLAIHNFFPNILKSFLPEHVKRLQGALSELPFPVPNASQHRDAEGCMVPPRPDSSHTSGATIDQLKQQLEVEREKHEEERKKHEEERKKHEKERKKHEEERKKHEEWMKKEEEKYEEERKKHEEWM
jgi:hypothetical protein